VRNGLESELRAAFEESTSWLLPRADLGDRVRRAARRRRLSRAGGSSLVVMMLAISVAVATVHRGQDQTGGQPGDGTPTVRIPVSTGVDAIAVAGSMLYIASGDTPSVDAALTVYDRKTARALLRVQVPARPQAIAIGRDGSVWLAFYADQNGGSPGVWRMSPDLRRRSILDLNTPGYKGAASFDVLPTNHNRAVLATEFGLATIELPPPGEPGPGSYTLQTTKPPPATPTELASLGGHIAVRQSSDSGDAHPQIVVAGQPGRTFDAGAGSQITSMSASPEGLWVTTKSSQARNSLSLLNEQLRQREPGPLVDDAALWDPEGVWASGHTVWLATSGAQASLVCFVFDRSRQITSAIKGGEAPGLLAATNDQVFVTEKGGVSGYSVPAACR
jgi:hypothetical protein